MPQPSSTIVEPRLACRSGKQNDPIECSLHTLPKPLMREFKHVFAEKYLNGDTSMGGVVEILAIPTNQHARHDLVAVGDEIEAEKDRLLNCVGRQFCFFAKCHTEMILSLRQSQHCECSPKKHFPSFVLVNASPQMCDFHL